MISRKEQQAELLISFGELIAPLEELVIHPDEQTEKTRSKACAKYTNDRPRFYETLNKFCKGEKGHNYSVESSAITQTLNGFTNQLFKLREDTEQLKNRLQEIRNIVKKNILSIPCELDTEIFEANSPFTVYIKLRSIVECANTQLTFIDPYISAGLIRRYFHYIPNNINITVITKCRTGGTEFNDFIDLSSLFANERGFSKYRLMYHPDPHDRLLKCDDDVYHLGGSIKDAGYKSKYTITKMQSITDGQDKINTYISESSEQFGPSHKNHPTT